MSEQLTGQAPGPVLNGVHHSARPTWKLKETVDFYRDVMGLELIHAIAARGWGDDDHPDFIHFFFDSGQDSTIAFFYYLNTPKPEETMETDHWLYRSVHTAWAVDTREKLVAWREKFEAHGLEVMQIRHELIESVYVYDPNGYFVEVTWQVRDMGRTDAFDAELTLQAAVNIEDETGARATSMEGIWQRKAELLEKHLRKAA